MNSEVLKNSAVSFSPLGLGSWPIGGNSYGNVDDQESLGLLELALEKGVRFIDTADIYGQGHSEELIGRAIQDHREEVFLATKAGWDFYHGSIRSNFDQSYLLFAIQDSLKRLKTDYVDLFQLHNPPVELVQNQGLQDLFAKLKDQKKIRHWGVSVHGPDEGLRWLGHSHVDAIQIAVNLLDQRAMDVFLPEAQSKKVAVIAREPLACGMLTGKYGMDTSFPKNDHRRRWQSDKIKQDLDKIALLKEVLPSGVPMAQIALEFVLSWSAVTVVIAGMKTVGQLEANIKAVQEKHLTQTTLQELRDLYQRHKIFSDGFYKN